MSVESAQVSVGTSATQLSSTLSDNESIALRNAGSADVFLGNSGVTTANGYRLAAGDQLGIDLNAGSEEIYGIVATGTVTVHVLRVGV